MRTVDAAVDTHLGDDRQVIFELVELIGAATTYRYTNAPLPITWNGFTWTNIDFHVGEFVLDGEGEVSSSVTFEDTSRTIRQLAFSVDLNLFQVKAWEAWATSGTNAIYGQDLIFQGTCDGVRSEREDSPNPVATIGVRGIFAASSAGIGPTQDYTRNCRYKQFKGPECQAVTAATFCDRLYATCVGFANQKNFGGFRWALEAGTVMQWGTNGAQAIPARPQPPYIPPPTGQGGGGAPMAPPPAPPRRRAA